MEYVKLYATECISYPMWKFQSEVFTNLEEAENFANFFGEKYQVTTKVSRAFNPGEYIIWIEIEINRIRSHYDNKIGWYVFANIKP